MMMMWACEEAWRRVEICRHLQATRCFLKRNYKAVASYAIQCEISCFFVS